MARESLGQPAAVKSLGVVLLAVGAAGCGQGSMICPGNVSPPPMVMVVDSANGENVCDAQVTATSGSSTLKVVQQGVTDAALSDADCMYMLEPPSQSGTYTIRVTAPGLHTIGTAPTVTITVGQCGPDYSADSFTLIMSP